MPSHRVGVYVHLSNHDGPQDPGHAPKNPGTTVGPSTTPHGLDPDKGSLLSVKRPTRFRQPSSQERHKERHSWSMDRCLAEQAAVLLPNRSGLSNPAAQKWVPWAAPVLRRETLTRKERGLGGRHTAHGKPLPSPISPGTPRNWLPGRKPLHCHPDAACQMGGRGCGNAWHWGGPRSKPLPLRGLGGGAKSPPSMERKLRCLVPLLGTQGSRRGAKQDG